MGAAGVLRDIHISYGIFFFFLTKNIFYSHQKPNTTATREFNNLQLALPLLYNSIIKLASISGIGKDKIHIVF